MLSLPALHRETLSTGEHANQEASLLFVKLNNEIRQEMALVSKYSFIKTSDSTGA